MKLTDLFENTPQESTLVLSRVSGAVSHDASVALCSEHALSLCGEDGLLHRFACSPSGLGELCAGWLFSEGYAAEAVEVSQDGRMAVARGVSPCPNPPEKLCLPRKTLASTQEMLALFHQTSDLYARTHGVHACVIKGEGWHIQRTDIGRHNAIDKAVGAAVLSGYALAGAVMFTSGRINIQTVQKAARCKLGCLMSKAVITREALQLAQALGLKVLFSVKEDSYLSI